MTETVPTSPSTSTAQLFRKKHERVQTIPVPTDTIIAFGDDGKNEIWRSGTNKWTEWEKGRDCGYWYACVKAHSNIYIIGGRRGVEDSTETDIYDISKEQWSKGPQLKVARWDAAACFDVYNSQIIVVGGRYKDDALKSVETLKVDGQGRPIGVWELIKSMKSRKDGCAAGLLDDKLFVSGGYTGDNVTASVEMLDLRSGSAEWKECEPPMHEKRRDHAMIAFNNELFVFGGQHGPKTLASCEKYSPINNTWQSFSNMPVACEGCGVCLMGDRIYVVGGYTTGGYLLNTVEVYNPDKDEWSEGPELTADIGFGITQCVSW